MVILCPECGLLPEYTSFCTLCAQLFRVKSRRRILESGVSAKAIAEELGCCLTNVYKWRRQLGLPVFDPRGRKRKAKT